MSDSGTYELGQENEDPEHFPWHYTEYGVVCACGKPMRDEVCPDQVGRETTCFVCGDEHTDDRHRLLILNGVEAWRSGREPSAEDESLWGWKDGRPTFDAAELCPCSSPGWSHTAAAHDESPPAREASRKGRYATSTSTEENP